MKPSEHIELFGTADGQIEVGGMPLTRLADRVGSTPFFAYERRLLDQRVDQLRDALPDGVELSYAMKANPMPALVQHLARRVDRLDVASGLELRTALDTPMPADRISFAGPGKTPAEITQAVAAGATLELESTTEFERVIAAGEALGLTPRVAIRVNPDFAVKGSGMRMGGGPQQFGIDCESVPDVLSKYRGSGVDMVGFHVFAGSQNLNGSVIAEAQRQTWDSIKTLLPLVPEPVRYVNFGGGFGIPYVEKDRPLDLISVTQPLHGLVAEMQRELPAASFVLELGRYLVGESGVYVTRILDRKESRGRTYLIVDGGMHHQLAASGNFGQAIRRNYPVAIGNRASGGDLTEIVTVVGCLCTPLDLLADTVELPQATIGDLVIIFQAGAYGLTASPAAFLGHPAPPEVLV